MAETLEALETIDLIYQAAVDPSLWPDALQKFAEACGGIGTAMIPITPHNTSGLVVSPELREPNVEYEREWWRHDTRVLRIYSRKLSDGVCCESQLFTQEEVARDPLRQDFCRAWGLGSFAAQLVAPLPDFVVAFSVQRALKRGEFEKHELETLGLLGRHAARALVISTQLTRARRLERTLTGTLAQLDCGALVVDHALKVLMANDAARAMVGHGLTIERGYLRAEAPIHNAKLVRLMRSALRPGAEAAADTIEPIALPRPNSRAPLLVQAMPVGADPGGPALPAGSAALVIVVDPEQEGRHDPVRALRLLGLTQAEARIAALVGTGSSRAEAAEALGISAWTANDTVKQAYSKLDITRQSELVRLVDRLAMLRTRRADEAGTRRGRPRRRGK